MHHLGYYIRDNLLIAMELSLKSPDNSFICFPLSLLHTVSCLVFLFLYSQDCIILEIFSHSVETALTTHPHAYIFLIGGFNA